MADFKVAVDIVIKHEGGYVNNPKDPGGETKFGITKRWHPNLNIKELTIENAEKIYFDEYWQPNRYGEIEAQDIANQILDLAVNCGAVEANKILQKSCNFLYNALTLRSMSPFRKKEYKLLVDGKIGDETLRLINNLDYDYGGYLVLVIIERIAAAYYVSLNKPVFENGWLKRLFENEDL